MQSRLDDRIRKGTVHRTAHHDGLAAMVKVQARGAVHASFKRTFVHNGGSSPTSIHIQKVVIQYDACKWHFLIYLR